MFVFFSETTDDEQFGKLLEKVSGNGYFWNHISNMGVLCGKYCTVKPHSQTMMRVGGRQFATRQQPELHENWQARVCMRVFSTLACRVIREQELHENWRDITGQTNKNSPMKINKSWQLNTSGDETLITSRQLWFSFVHELLEKE